MLVVNLFAGPGAGKTTLRALIFAELKMAGGGLDVEEAIEVAKEHVRERREVALGNRIQILGDQFHRVFRLEGQVDVVVNDSPVLLNGVYAAREGWPRCYADLCRWAHDRHESLNVWVERRREHGFQQAGRREAEAACLDLDAEIRGMLDRERIAHMVASSGYEGARQVAAAVLERVRGLRGAA